MSAAQAEAILFGLALGDALGYPTEFMTLPDIRRRYGVGGISEPPIPALYTDDTQMTVALTEGLLDAGLHAPLDKRMNAIAARFVRWMNSPDNNRAPGMTCMKAVGRLEIGIAWREAGQNNSKGCGSAMRVAAIGYLYADDDELLRETAEFSSLITHGHPAATAASVAAAYAIKLGLTGVPLTDYLPRILNFVNMAGEMSEDFSQALRRVGHVGGWEDEDAALDHIGQGWTGDEAVALALYCVLRYPHDYVACMRRAAATNGDSDSIACIAGGMMGARLGLDAIPAAWRERCENAAGLRQLAARMALARSGLTQV